MTYEFEFNLKDGTSEIYLAEPEFKVIDCSITTPLGTDYKTGAKLISCRFIKIFNKQEQACNIRIESDLYLIRNLTDAFERSTSYDVAVKSFMNSNLDD